MGTRLEPPPGAAGVSHDKMPKLLAAGQREDYPADFLDTVDRIGTICECLDRLESLWQLFKKDGMTKQTQWARAGEAFKQYGDETITPAVGEIFQRAAKKFNQISALYQHIIEVMESQFRNPLHEFNQKEVKALKESLKKLDQSKKIQKNSKTKLDRKPNDMELKIASEVAQKVHEEQFKLTKESVLKFLESTSFFEKIVAAFIAADKELSDKAHQEILKIIYTY
ncbi:hypothetical protein COOONC_04167 [Cooperia oncophora]